jgi:hypothetical protein
MRLAVIGSGIVAICCAASLQLLPSSQYLIYPRPFVWTKPAWRPTHYLAAMNAWTAAHDG